MSRKSKFFTTLLLTQTICIAIGIGLQHFCIQWSARDAFVRSLQIELTKEAQQLGRGQAPSPTDRSKPAIVRTDENRRIVSVDREAQDASSLEMGITLEWMPGTLQDHGDGRLSGVVTAGGVLFHAMSIPAGEPEGSMVVLRSEAFVEQQVTAAMKGVASVSVMTLVWTASLLGVSGFLLIGRHQNEIEQERQRTLQEFQRQRQDLIRTRDAVIVGLAKLAESRDPGTGDHLDRISMYSTTLAGVMMRHPEFMSEVTPSFVRLIGTSAALHDIGKVGVEDRILLKPGKLSPNERLLMEDHSRAGGECLREIERRLGSSNFLHMAREIAFAHHERWDGSGYPAGLTGERIPLAARIVAIADVYDALASRRVYKEPLSHDQCVAIIREGAGTQFDPRIVEAWLTVADRFRDIAESFTDRHARPFDDRRHEPGAANGKELSDRREPSLLASTSAGSTK